MRLFKKKNTNQLEYDVKYSIDSCNIVPAEITHSDKFIEDGKNCVAKELKELRDKKVDDLNTDVATGYHKGDTYHENAYLNKAKIDVQFCAKNIFCKQFGEVVLLMEKLELFEEDIRSIEKELSEAEKRLAQWRARQ